MCILHCLRNREFTYKLGSGGKWEGWECGRGGMHWQHEAAVLWAGAGICGLGTRLLKCSGGSNLHNTAAGPHWNPLAVSLCISGERKGNKSRGDNSYQQACRYVFTTNPWRLTRRPWNQIIVLSNQLWCMHDRQIVHYGSTWLFCQRNLVSSRLLAAPSTQTVDHSLVVSVHIQLSPPRGISRILLIPISVPAQVSPSNRSSGEVGPKC